MATGIPAVAEPPDDKKVDVLVYGGTPAGIAAAVEAGRAGRSVLLVEPYSQVGGMLTNGLSHADFHTFEGLSGAYLNFIRRVEQHYIQRFGKDSPEVRSSFRGAFAEPSVNLVVFREMLAEHAEIAILHRHRISAVRTQQGASPETKRIAVAVLVGPDGGKRNISASIFIDASYEGDLMAMAGACFTVGREARDTYGESLAPVKADGQVQGYNFRLTMTQDPELRVPAPKPEGYDRREFLPLLAILDSGQIDSVFGYPRRCIYKAAEIPRGKYNVNDVSYGTVRLSLPQLNDAWPNADPKARRRLYDEHLRYNIGMLYFLRNDEAVPSRFQDEARTWGFCRDEYPEHNHLPEQLYVREGRRMIGKYVFTEGDTDHADGDARAVLRTDAIAMGEYGPNCHGTGHEGPKIGGRHTGEFYKAVPPYQIPYGVLVPEHIENLLVPVACSSSHVGFCALRLEPIWMSLGQASGIAATIATGDNSVTPVQHLDVKHIQHELHRRKSATIYVADVLPDHPDFDAVQWWGTHGGLHGLHPMPSKPGQRGKHIRSQYFEANPGHTANLDRPMARTLRARWTELAAELGLVSDDFKEARTQGEFIRIAYAARKRSEDERSSMDEDFGEP